MKLRLHDNQEIFYDLSSTRNHQEIYRALKQHGLYQIHDRSVQGKSPLRLGVMGSAPGCSSGGEGAVPAPS